jgi:imidazolonepropionase-like amidohydrolase
MHVTSPYLEGPGSFAVQMHALTGPDDAKKFVDFWADQGVTSFKAYNFLTRAELKAAIDEAHARHLKLTAHLCSIGFREAAEMNIDDLEHGLLVDTEFYPEKKPDFCPDPTKAILHLLSMDVNGTEIQQTIHMLIEHHVAVTSTLPVFENFVPGRPNQASARVLAAMSEPAKVSFLAARAATDDPARNQARYGQPTSPWTSLFKMEMEFEHSFAKQGGLLLAGTDPTGNGGTLAGFGSQREVELLVEEGFTPVEAIQVATQNGAKYLGIDNEVGTIAPGKAADLILVKGAPDKNIMDIEKVDIVFKDGIGYDPQKLIDAVRGHVGLN